MSTLIKNLCQIKQCFFIADWLPFYYINHGLYINLQDRILQIQGREYVKATAVEKL